MNKINIKDLFAGLQNQMNAQLNTNREFIVHPGSKGDALENTWIEWLRKYLPNRYSVDKAIVIDAEGNTSDQIDVVIYDNWFTPFMFTQNGFHYIPAEGVYAVFEVKPDIQGNVGSDTYIKYAAKKIESVRKLKRSSTNIIDCGIVRNPRPLTKIVGGILCSSNSFTPKNNNTLEGHIKDLSDMQGIDIGCIADYGSFYVDYDGEEDLKLKTKEYYQERFEKYYKNRKIKSVEFSKPENSLITFFLQLTRYLQQAIGTVPAIDLQAYLSSVGEKIDQ